MNAAAAINVYSNISTEFGVNGADSHPRPISMLFQGTLLAISKAKSGISCKETAIKGKFYAIAIISDELVQNLSSLYGYMVMRLVDANLKNDITVLDEVARLLTGLTKTWDNRPDSLQSGSSKNNSGHAQRVCGRA